MGRRLRKAGRKAGPTLLVVVVTLLVVGTISNQIRINATNAKLQAQAQNGQKALNRACKLAGVSQKIYVDNLQRGVIDAQDFALVIATTRTACSHATP